MPLLNLVIAWIAVGFALWLINRFMGTLASSTAAHRCALALDGPSDGTWFAGAGPQGPTPLTDNGTHTEVKESPSSPER